MKRILLVALFLTGCTQFDKMVQSNVGKHVDDVVVEKGAPNRSSKRQDGGVTYTWINRGCKINYTTNKDGVITQYSHTNCPNF